MSYLKEKQQMDMFHMQYAARNCCDLFDRLFITSNCWENKIPKVSTLLSQANLHIHDNSFYRKLNKTSEKLSRDFSCLSGSIPINYSHCISVILQIFIFHFQISQVLNNLKKKEIQYTLHVIFSF